MFVRETLRASSQSYTYVHPEHPLRRLNSDGCATLVETYQLIFE